MYISKLSNDLFSPVQVEIADCMQTLFRGNSLASKIMSYCFKIYGQGYLRELLNPLIMQMFYDNQQGVSYEVDPARSVITQCHRTQICYVRLQLKQSKTYFPC
jgi:hypothetical protein